MFLLLIGFCYLFLVSLIMISVTFIIQCVSHEISAKLHVVIQWLIVSKKGFVSMA